MRNRIALSLVILVLFGGAVGEHPLAAHVVARLAPTGDAVVPGEIRADTTFEHIGVLWWIEGDDDLDSAMSLEFRRKGESAWHPGAPAMRAYPSIRVQDGLLGLNYWAASALFLSPGETYELRVNLADQDGGGNVRTITATTRKEPQADPDGRQLHVVAGDGGGDGSAGNPFRGLAAAAAAAQAGDLFYVASGIYQPVQLLASGISGHPITFQGPMDGTAVLDGAGTDRGILTLGEYNQTIGHIIIEGLTIENGHWGIDAQHSHDIVIRHNIIRDVDDGITNRRGDALERNQTVCDNVISGRTLWPQTEGQIPGERGVDLRGYGNVVCHNSVRFFGDCISVQPSTGASYGNDVFGNDVSYCVDDGIEVDYNQANARVWRNRVLNSRMGVSLQPVRGGPAYVFRNEFFNLESVPVKMHNNTTGFFVVHNSGVKHGDAYGDNGAMWRNAVLRNNIFLGTRYAFEFTTVPDEGYRDFDYNAWGTTRTIDPGGPFFKWNNVRYDNLSDLPAGVEDLGVQANFEDLANAELPDDWHVAAEPGSRDLRLVGGKPEIDAGVDLANLNDAFALSASPDIGAFEYGEPAPHYGPRAPNLDLSASLKRVNRTVTFFGNPVTYTIELRNTGASLANTVYLTDDMPGGVRLIDGSCTVLPAGGMGSLPILPPTKCQDNVVTWQGSLTETFAMTFTFVVTIAVTEPAVIVNNVVIAASGTPATQRSAVIVANGHAVYLPLFVGSRAP